MQSAAPHRLPPTVARAEVQSLRSSKIREVANAAMDRKDVLPFWFGEPDEETPQEICEAGLGLAPGVAFGPEGEGYLRWCYASSTARLDEGVGRLAAYLDHTPNT